MWIPTLSEKDQPRYLALVDAITQAIACGELQPGARLPPQRRLAWALGWNPSTTMQAYREAARRHLVSGEVGRGTYVLASSQEATLFRLQQADENAARIDLRTNVPAIDHLGEHDAQALSWLLDSRQAIRLQGYLSAADLLLARVQGAAWFKGRGLDLNVDHIMPCTGAQQGLFTVLLSLCQAGEPVLVEAFTAPGIKAACAQLRLPMHGVALDREGIVEEDFDRMIRATGARIAVLTPTLQNPTSAVMSIERKQAIAHVARRHGVLIIEDDVYGALTDSPPLYRFLPELSVLVSSLSKTVAAGVRLGWIVASPELLARIDPYAQSAHWGVSPLCMAIACQWIGDGTAQARVQWQTGEVARRWRLAKKILGPGMYQTQTPSPHIWLTVADSEIPLAEACRAAGVDVVPADVFTVKPTATNAVRISLTAAASIQVLKVALERIAGKC
ncbi:MULTISPECIES: PLP-dependent aminotransferase family protein [unclassified Pseudomonas]|uniref:aminotransferase-like domain-containing protein n=1 Tax=unclassified Pseudomonas TaxID=196821 RepID=UPI002DBC42DA|nr:PLP-dependent aminotransferase family protein [Pseudomonas sp. MS-1(2024)]MEC4167456.1 PLP-dependent aminotransferase family protein [Pseudomonas sp. MS-1(2024)]